MLNYVQLDHTTW